MGVNPDYSPRNFVASRKLSESSRKSNVMTDRNEIVISRETIEQGFQSHNHNLFAKILKSILYQINKLINEFPRAAEFENVFIDKKRAITNVKTMK